MIHIPGLHIPGTCVPMYIPPARRAARSCNEGLDMIMTSGNSPALEEHIRFKTRMMELNLYADAILGSLLIIGMGLVIYRRVKTGKWFWEKYFE